MRHFSRFLPTFGAARPVFDESGSQKPDFPLCSHRFLIILPSALDFSRKGFFKAPLAAFLPGFFRMTNTASKALSKPFVALDGSLPNTAFTSILLPKKANHD